MARTSRKTYRGLTPGKYAGQIAGDEGTITVSDDGTFTTSKREEQLFVETALGWEGTEDDSSKASSDKKE